MRLAYPFHLRSAFALSLVSLISGCNSNSGTETDNPLGPEGTRFVRSPVAYQDSISVTDAEREALSDQNRALALSLYRTVAASAAPDANLFLGTHSVTSILAMTYAGARGETEVEMSAALGFPSPGDSLHPAMNALSQSLTRTTANTAVRYDALNSLWVASDREVQSPFLDLLSEQYDTGVYLVDFAADSEGARTAINDWVREQTSGNIDQLFGPGSVGANTALALTNAAFLTAPWQDRFDPESTQSAEFLISESSAVDVPMMSRTFEYPYALTVDWRAFELPFTDTEMGMVFVLPNVGEFSEFEASFGGDLAAEIVDALTPETVALEVPRFEFSSSLDLKPALESLGMASAFVPGTADFSGIDGQGEISLDTFVHQTTIGVDENGTTAAAATGEILVPLAITPRIRLDRPFFFFVYDHETRTVLFIGRLVHPEGDAHTPTNPPAVLGAAEAICSGLSGCTDRATTEAECLASLSADDDAVVEACADCIQLGVDVCGSLFPCDWGMGDVCEPSTCAEYCPSHAF